jgi:hypothetical protein
MKPVKIDKGWFYLGFWSEIYLFHLALGRLDISVLHTKYRRDKIRAARIERLNKLRGQK